MALHDAILDALAQEKERRKNPPFRLHNGVRGAHPQFGGTETPERDIALDDTRFGPEARFTMGPEGRDTMNAGGDVMPVTPKRAPDTEPYLRRRDAPLNQLPLPSDDPAFKPTDPITHFVRMKNPQLGNDYHFDYGGSNTHGHQIDVYHQNRAVGFLSWNGTNAIEPGGFHEHGLAPGEIRGVSVHPDHRGVGLSTAMWDYARAHNALYGSNEPVHSADRSTAGNHWAHFVGGASLPRRHGQDVDEYFKGSW